MQIMADEAHVEPGRGTTSSFTTFQSTLVEKIFDKNN